MTTVGTVSVVFDTTRMRNLLGNFLVVNQDAADHALNVVAKELLKDSRLYVPVLTGKLKDSGRIEGYPSVTETRRVVQVIYGNDSNILYAALQHEKPFNHPSLGFFGPAKYLERRLVQNAAFYRALFIAEYQIYMMRLR